MGKMGPVEKRVMEDIFQPEVMREHIPRMDEIQDGAAKLRAMHEEIGTLGKHIKAGGFTPGVDFQHVAKIDSSIMNTLEDLHQAGCCSRNLFGPNGHKQWFFDWLKEYGYEFDVRGKVVL